MDNALFAGVDLMITVLKAFRFYGISLYDAILWTVWFGIAWYVVTFFFNAVKGGNDD